jgi:hypothetical protein
MFDYSTVKRSWQWCGPGTVRCLVIDLPLIGDPEPTF